MQLTVPLFGQTIEYDIEPDVCVFYSSENSREPANKRSPRHVRHVRLRAQRRNRDEGENVPQI